MGLAPPISQQPGHVAVNCPSHFELSRSLVKIIIDTREQDPLSFVEVEDVEIIKSTVDVGDYAAQGANGLFPIRIERKSVGDLFSSFQGENYERERAKIIRASVLGLKYIIAVEASASEVRKGHTYMKDGELKESKKGGLSQVRQLMTIAHKYSAEIWFCNGRSDMAFRIMEYFLAYKRHHYDT